MTFTANNILTLAKRNIRDQGSTALENEQDYLDAITEAQQRLAEETRILHKRAEIKLQAGVRTYELPSDWIDFMTEVLHYNYQDDDFNWQRRKIEIAPYETLVHRYRNFDTETGTPRFFWIQGNEIGIYPTVAHNLNTVAHGTSQIEDDGQTWQFGDSTAIYDGDDFIAVPGDANGVLSLADDSISMDYFYNPLPIMSGNDVSPFPDKFLPALGFLVAAIICRLYEDYEQENIMLMQYVGKLRSVFSAGSIPLNSHTITSNSYFGG